MANDAGSTITRFSSGTVAQGIATKEVVEAYGAEIRALSDFPPSLLQAGGVKAPAALPGAMKWVGATELEQNTKAMSAWRATSKRHCRTF
jgi:hypothetical protein